MGRGGQFVQCKYKGIFEEETVILHLRIVAESSEYREMGKPSQDEIDNRSFVRSGEGQEKFFGGKGKKMVTETLNRLGGIEGIRRLGCGQVPSCYVPHSKIATVIIEGIKNKEIELGR